LSSSGAYLKELATVVSNPPGFMEAKAPQNVDGGWAFAMRTAFGRMTYAFAETSDRRKSDNFRIVLVINLSGAME
jgi:hypothetical protein